MVVAFNIQKYPFFLYRPIYVFKWFIRYTLTVRISAELKYIYWGYILLS